MPVTKTAGQGEGRKWTLRAILPAAWSGPFFTFLAGLMLIGDPFQPAGLVLLVICTIYLGIGYAVYSKLCRIATLYTVTAGAVTIPSILFFLATVRLVGAESMVLTAVLAAAYIIAWFLGMMMTARRGIRTYLDSYHGKREVDLVRGLIDLTNRGKIAHAFRPGQRAKSIPRDAELSPQEKHWFRKWGWVIALLIFMTPICSALNIAFVDEMSSVAQDFYLILLYYVVAVGSALGAGSGWTWYFLWRRWEKENGRPMLIKYLEDRYIARKPS